VEAGDALLAWRLASNELMDVESTTSARSTPFSPAWSGTGLPVRRR